MREKSNIRRKTYKRKYQKSRKSRYQKKTKRRYQKKSKRRSKRMRGGAAAGGGEAGGGEAPDRMETDLYDGGLGVKAVAAAEEAREKEQYYEALATLAHLSKGEFLTKSDHDKIKVENTLEGIERVLLEVLKQIPLRQMGKGFDYDAALKYFEGEGYSETYLLRIMDIMQEGGKGPF
jgi:hypothetical protein